MERNTKNNSSTFDYKDISSLRKFISEKGKITPRRISYISIKKQKDLSNAIKRASRIMNNKGRLLIRKSGTEPKIRIMGESENKNLLRNFNSFILVLPNIHQCSCNSWDCLLRF